jgi:hypothetical protein
MDHLDCSCINEDIARSKAELAGPEAVALSKGEWASTR